MVASAPYPQPRQLDNLLRSVVKVQCVSDAPDYDQPWQSQGPKSRSGSGAIIRTELGLRVLTNAHCVANQVFVEVTRHGSSNKHEAEVEAIGHDCDLALIRVDDPDFFSGAAPFELGTLPHLSDRVSVCGFPIGGEQLSITEGIVSRIELVSYAQSSRELLAVQIDAAINSGNSGGPVIRDDRLVGVAFQALDDAESVGYMIAPPVVQHFLADVARGGYRGFPSLGVDSQPLESRAHRRALGLPDRRRGGVLVKRVAHGGASWGVLEEGDVLLAVDGTPIAADGTVDLGDEGLINFRYRVQQRHVGERMPVTVWRRRQELTCVIELRPPQRLVPEERYDVRPSYYLYGGMLFVPLTRDFLETWGDSWWRSAPRELVSLYENGIPTSSKREVVVLQKVLADRVNQGYHEIENLVVSEVDGQPVASLRELIALVEDNASEPFVSLVGSDGTRVVLDRDQVAERRHHVLSKFGVVYDRSIDLRAPSVRSAEPRSSDVFTADLRSCS